MNEAALLDALTAIFRDVFDDAAIALTPDTSARDIAGWDSGKMVLLVLAVEDRFAITMKTREIDALRCIGDWVRLLQAYHVCA